MTPPAQVNPERVRAAITARGELVGEIADGALGTHRGHGYEASLIETDLVVRHALGRLLPHEARRGLLQLLNDWNRDRILPTLHLTEHTEGLGVAATCTLPVGRGMTRAQLAEALEVGVVLGAAAIQATAAALPDADA